MTSKDTSLAELERDAKLYRRLRASFTCHATTVQGDATATTYSLSPWLWRNLQDLGASELSGPEMLDAAITVQLRKEQSDES